MMKKTTRMKKLAGVVAWSALAAGLSAHWIARAQQGQTNDDPRFTGFSESLDTEGLRVSHRRFEAGARSAWHYHSGGQLLFVEEGRARTQKRGGAMREMGVGEADYTDARVEHWHGAAPDVHFIQVATGISDGIEWTTEWLDKVTDDEYNGR